MKHQGKISFLRAKLALNDEIKIIFLLIVLFIIFVEWQWKVVIQCYGVHLLCSDVGVYKCPDLKVK